MAERRSHTRYTVSADINLKTEEGVSYSFKTGVANIGFRGVTILSREKVDLENKVVHFELLADMSKDPLVGKGLIKYNIRQERNPGPAVFKMGLEFIDVNKGAVLHFINRLQDMRSSKIRKTRLQKTGCDFYGAF